MYIFVSMIMATLHILCENCCCMWMYCPFFIYNLIKQDFQIKIIWICEIDHYFFLFSFLIPFLNASLSSLVLFNWLYSIRNKDSFNPLVLFGHVCFFGAFCGTWYVNTLTLVDLIRRGKMVLKSSHTQSQTQKLPP